jgi:hypothetical protein
MEPDLLPLDTVPVQDTIPLDNTAPLPPSTAVATSRAAKAEMGLFHVTGQGLPQIYQQILDGNEDTYRSTAAAALDKQAMADRQKYLSALAIRKGSMLTLDEVRNAVVPPTNPDSVIEQAYAEKRVQDLHEAAARMQSDVLSDADAEDPDKIREYFSRGSKTHALIEYANKVAQDLQTEVQNDAWFHVPFFETPWTPDGTIDIGSRTAPWMNLLNTLTNIPHEFYMRGNVPGVNWFAGGGEASNVKEQAYHILTSPTFEEGKAKIDAAVAAIKKYSPADAQMWAASIAGLSTNELITRDVMSAVTLTGAAGAVRTIAGALKSAGGRGVAKLGKPTSEAPRASEGPSVDSEAVQRARTAVEDVLASSPASPTKANIAEAAGDTKEAGIQKAVETLTQGEDGVYRPLKEAEDTLMAAHRQTQVAIRNNPGNLSREVHTRIIDDADGFDKNLIDTIITTSKLVTIPQIVENGFRGVADKLSEHFKGREMTISDIDVVHDPISNVYNHIVKIVDYNGERFLTPEQAKNHATINGYGNAKIVGNDTNIVYLPKVAVLTPNPNYDVIRFFHGGEEKLPSKIGPRWLTPQEDYARNYGIGNKTVHYVDIFREEAIKHGGYDEINGHPQNFEAPKSIARQLELYKGADKHVELRGKEKFIENPELEVRLSKEGNTKFFHVKKKGTPDQWEQEIIPKIKPDPGDIPYNLKTNKFGDPVGDGPHIVSQGLGYHIEWNVPLDQTQSFVRDALIGPRTTAHRFDNSRFTQMANGILGYLRLPNDTLSIAEVENRGKLVFSKNKIMSLLQKEMSFIDKIYRGELGEGSKYVGKITGRNRQVWNEFVRALTVAQKAPDPITKLPGYIMETPAEIQHFWQTNFGRMATEAEQRAYLAYGRINMADFVFRNISEYAHKGRLGIMNHVLKTIENGQTTRSPVLEGRMYSKLPPRDFAALVHEGDGNQRLLNNFNKEDRAKFKKDLEAGKYRGIQLWDPEKRPLSVKDVEGNPLKITYVFSRSMESSPLTYNQVRFRGGAHWDYAYDRFIKMPITRKQILGGKTQWIYEGDATYSPGFKSNAETNAFVGKLNSVLDLLEAKKYKEAKALWKTFSDQPWKEFSKGFFQKPGTPTRFDVRQRFHNVPRGSTIMDLDDAGAAFSKQFGRHSGAKFKGDPIIDGTRRGSLARNYQVEFTGARDSYDLYAPENVGSISKPLYHFEPATLTDPIPVLQRSLRRIIDSQAGDAYKWSAMEHWLQEEGGLLNSKHGLDEIRGNPYWWFNKGDMKAAARYSLRGLQAESNRYKIKTLLGMPSRWDSIVHTMKQTLADWSYDSGVFTKAITIPAEWGLNHLSKPVDMLTGLAFHSIFGFWNASVFMAQQTAWLNVISQAPKHVAPAMAAAWLHVFTHFSKDPAFIKHIGKISEQFGWWKPGQLERAMKHYDNVGFNKVGNTLIFQNKDNNFLVNSLKRRLNQSTMFFSMAEQFMKHGAWYAAFREFEHAFPNRAIGDLEEGMILNRANNMYVNMDRSSRTILSEGMARLPLQFLGYMERMGQLFFSKRMGDVFGKENTWQLRAQNRAMMYIMYAAAFGPAGATGLTILPFGDWFRRYALDNGYTPGQNTLSTLLMDGPLSLAGAYLSGWWRTGKLDPINGTFYNFNDRYGVNGLQVFRDVLEPSSTFWKILLGAGGSTFANYLASGSGLVNATYSAFTDSQDNPWPLMFADWKAGLRNINSFRYSERLAYALAFHEWLGRHGEIVQQNVGEIDAIFRTLFGTTDVKISDGHLMQVSIDEREQMYKTARNEYYEQKRLANEAALNNDYNQADDYNKRAMFAIHSRHVPSEVAAEIFAGERNLHKPTIDKILDNYYSHRIPTDKIPLFKKTFQYIMKNPQ